MKEHLFIFTVSPVQKFIAQARKARDLYAGSQILSELTSAALKELQHLPEGGQEVIFPDSGIENGFGRIGGLPNRIVAILKTDSPQTVPLNVERAVRNRLKSIAEEAYNSKFSIQDKLGKKFVAQIEDYFYYNWVITSVENTDYAEKYKRIEKLLAAAKNLRCFRHPAEEGGRKCSLCGERNALFYRPIPDKNAGKEKAPAFLQKEALPLRDPQMVSGEGLCALCFTTRYWQKVSFPSLAEIALLSGLYQLMEEKRGRELLKSYIHLFPADQFDPELFYEENLTEHYFIKNFSLLEERERAELLSRLKEIKARQKEIAGVLRKKNLPLNRYYAMIRADADRIGKWLAGDYLAPEQKNRLKDFHWRLSRTLSEYAGVIKEGIFKDKLKWQTLLDLLENFSLQELPKGKVIYAGGDDLLALVNLSHLFNVLDELCENFPDFGKKTGFILEGGKKSTFSAGVVVAHYKTPLHEVLQWSAKLLDEAKEEGGRDAFALAVLKRSGEVHKTVWKWCYESQEEATTQKPIPLLKELIKELTDDKTGFSRKFIAVLGEEFRRLVGADGSYMEEKQVESEIRRLLDRSSRIKNQAEKKRKAGEWADRLVNLYVQGQANFENFLSLLNIADFISKEVGYAD